MPPAAGVGQVGSVFVDEIDKEDNFLLRNSRKGEVAARDKPLVFEHTRHGLG